MIKVLIVEPDREKCSCMKDFFETEGCQTDCALCGFETFYICHKKYFDIILINFDLPDINGAKIAINLLKYNSDTLFIMTTDKERISERRFCKRNKIKLLKNPFSQDQLFEILGEIQEQKTDSEIRK